MLQDAEPSELSPEIIEDLHVLHRNIQRVMRVARGLLMFARRSPEQRRLVVMNWSSRRHYCSSASSSPNTASGSPSISVGTFRGRRHRRRHASGQAGRRSGEPFYTTKTAGTGRIIAEHEGTVDVSSEPGRGTTFTFRSPSHSGRSAAH
jgi:hypothetical protein